MTCPWRERVSDLAPLVALQDETRNRQSPEMFAGGLEFDFCREGDFPDRHLGLPAQNRKIRHVFSAG